MKKIGLFFISAFMMVLASNAQSVSTLNNYFSTYGHNIKTNNFFSPQTNVNCIYDTHYMTASKQGKLLILNFGFGWDEKYGYIHKCVLKIDLSSATFYSGFWTRGYFDNRKWEHRGRKEEITIEDKNGIDLTYTGEQNYNRGTKQDLISKIVISFGTEPIANRVINELYGIQESYKAKEPWLLPEPEPQKQEPSSSNKTTIRRTTTTKKNTNNTKKLNNQQKRSKSGKYGQ